MFTNITWTHYLEVISLLLIIYYLLIGMRFYYRDLKNLIGKRKLLADPVVVGVSNTAETEQSGFTPNDPVQISDDDPFRDVEQLVNKLSEAIQEASVKNTSRESFSQCLCLILKEYPELKTSPFQAAINALILSECAKYGSMTLSEDEIAKLWEAV